MRMSEEHRELWEPSEMKGNEREEDKSCSDGRGEVRVHELEEEFGFSSRPQDFGIHWLNLEKCESHYVAAAAGRPSGCFGLAFVEVLGRVISFSRLR